MINQIVCTADLLFAFDGATAWLLYAVIYAAVIYAVAAYVYFVIEIADWLGFGTVGALILAMVPVILGVTYWQVFVIGGG